MHMLVVTDTGAASYVSTLSGYFLILTDSLSSVSALAPGLASSRYIVPKNASLLSGFLQNKVIAHWVPSHVKIPGKLAMNWLIPWQKIPTSFLCNPNYFSHTYIYLKKLSSWMHTLPSPIEPLSPAHYMSCLGTCTSWLACSMPNLTAFFWH